MPKTLAKYRNHRAQLTCDRRALAAKVPWLVIALVTSLSPTLQADAAPVDQAVSTAPVISSRGPHHRVWSRTNVITGPDGGTRTNASSYVELGSGMHRWDAQAGQWVDAEAVLAIEGNTAVGRKGAYQVTFAANANTAGAIDLVAPDGKRFRSHVLGIALFNSANSRSEMIGTLKDSPGELHPPNIVLYPDAFDGVKADLRYTYRLGSFEQDVILRANPLLPAGFAPDTTRLECWTEFIESPAAALRQRARSGMTDDVLDFGALQTGAGNAFALSEEPNPRKTALVAKRWLTVDGRTLLVEAVRYNSVKQYLDKLPAAQAAIQAPNANAQLAAAAQPHFGERPFPAAPQARANKLADIFRTAAVIPSFRREGQSEGVPSATTTNASLNLQPSSLGSPGGGLVIDYTLNGSLSGFTLQCDTTYYVSNTVHFSGTTTVEGGTVVKFARTNTATLSFDAGMDWRTAQYWPAIFTAVDDNTVGDTILSGTPTGYYGGTYLSFTSDLGTPRHIRISYAATGLKSSSYSPTIRHAQFLHCSNALYFNPGVTATVTLENALFYDVATLQDGQANVSGAHLTVHQCAKFSNSENMNANVLNSLLIRMTNWGNVTSNLVSSVWNTDDSEFQTVGAGAHYLVPGSVRRNAGTTSGLSAQMLADLKTRTTYPPIVLAQPNITNQDLTLSPQAQRDTDTPDIGYHYDPLDFVAVSHFVTNATITLTPGVAVGIAAVNANYGFSFGAGGRLVSTGSATNLNRIVRYSTVQEQANTNWSGSANNSALNIGYWSGAPVPSIQCRFTEFSTADASWAHIAIGTTTDSTIGFADCQIHSGHIFTTRAALTLTNCVLNRVVFGADDSFGDYAVGLVLRNTTFQGGSVAFYHDGADAWTLRDNLLALTNISNSSGTALDADYNGYVTNAVRLNTSATHDVTNLVFSFDTGALGHFYLPTSGPATNLFDKGSTYATNVGLYHFTTTTNQVKEGTTTNDLGFHYIALNSSGLPVDTDEDGLPDYWEDGNGNGSLDHRETKPNDAADRGLRVFITRPKSGSTIP